MMNIRGAIWHLVLVAALLSSSTLAQGTLEYDYDADFMYVDDNWNGSGWEILVYADWAFKPGPSALVWVKATAGTCPIDWIYLVCDQYQSLENNLLLIVEEDGGTIPHITTIKNLYEFSEGEVWVARVEISGYVGDSNSPHNYANAIDADIVSRVIAHAGVFSDLISGPREFGGRSTIQEVRTSTAPIRGHITAPYGDIYKVISSDTIGTSADPVNIWSNGDLEYLECQDLYADVDTGHYGTAHPLHELYVESTDPNRGNFEGRIHCLYVSKIGDEGNGEILVTGNLTGDIDIDDDLAEDLTIGGVLDAADPLTIGAQLKANDGVPVVIHFDNPLGLEGQIIINAINTGQGWNGIVEFAQQSGGPIALAPVPYYNNESDDIGGGAVGLVPYYLHYADCTPTATKVNEDAATGLDGYNPATCIGIHIDEVLIPLEPLPSVTLHHYGPVLREGTGMPVTIHRRQMAAACAWETEDIAPNFTLVMHPGGNLREARIEGPFTEGYYYLIEPKDEDETDYLYCDGLDVSVGKVAVHDYDLVMRVRRLQDLSLNGLMDPDDITAWLLDPQDTTLDGTTDNNDLVDVINAVAEYGE